MAEKQELQIGDIEVQVCGWRILMEQITLENGANLG